MVLVDDQGAQVAEAKMLVPVAEGGKFKGAIVPNRLF